MPATILPYMNLVLPEVGVTIGPDWATALNNNVLAYIDSHTHTLGAGRSLPLTALVASNWNFGKYAITKLNSTGYDTVTIDPVELQSVYSKSGELFFKDGSGNLVQITQGGSVLSVAGNSITVDVGAVTAPTFFYTDSGALTGVLQLWEKKASPYVRANLVCSDLTIYEHAASIDEGVTIKSPSGLVASYSLTLPSSLPASTSILALTSAGIIAPTRSLVIDALQLTASPTDKYVMMCNAAGIGSWQKIVSASIDSLAVDSGSLGTNSVSTSKIVPFNVTREKLESVGEQVSISSGLYGSPLNINVWYAVTNLNVSVNTTGTGRPIMIILQNDGTDHLSSIHNISGSYFDLKIERGGVDIWFSGTTSSSGFSYGIVCLDVAPAGVNTYTVQVKCVGGLGQVGVFYYKLVAYEL